MKHQTVFLGFFKLDSEDVWGILSVSDASDVPSEATGTPTFLVTSKVIPLGRGGVNVRSNLIASCRPCNNDRAIEDSTGVGLNG